MESFNGMTGSIDLRTVDEKGRSSINGTLLMACLANVAKTCTQGRQVELERERNRAISTFLLNSVNLKRTGLIKIYKDNAIDKNSGQKRAIDKGVYKDIRVQLGLGAEIEVIDPIELEVENMCRGIGIPRSGKNYELDNIGVADGREEKSVKDKGNIYKADWKHKRYMICAPQYLSIPSIGLDESLQVKAIVINGEGALIQVLIDRFLIDIQV